MAGDDTPEVGDKVSWQHGGSHPGDEVAEKKTEGELAIQSKRGNTIKAKGSHDDPAVHLARSGNDVVKKQSALEVEEKGSGSATDGAKSKAEESKADEDKGLANGESSKAAPKSAKKGEKRKAEEDAGDDTPAKKSRGRPKAEAKAETPAKEKKTPKKAAEKKEKTPKKAAATTDGEKKPRGRPKKDGSAPTKGSGVNKTKAKAPPVKGSVGTRTRSTK